MAPPFEGAAFAAAGWAGGAGLGAPLPLEGDAFGASWWGAGAGADEPPLPEEPLDDELGASWCGAGADADEPPPDDEEPDDSWCAGDGPGELPPPDPPPGPPIAPAAGLRFHVNGRADGAGDTEATSRTDAEPPSARTGDTAPTAAGDRPGPATTNAAPVPSATASRGTPDDSAADSGARVENVTSKAACTRRRAEPSNTTHPHGGTSRNQIRGEDRSSNVMPSPSAAGDQHPTAPGENTGTTGRADTGHRQAETGGNCPPETLPGALRRPDPTTPRGTNRTGKPRATSAAAPPGQAPTDHR